MEIVDRRIPLSQIGKTVGPSPVPRFLGNVKRNGIVVPVLLQEIVGEDGEIEYRIIDGNRRVAAARKAGLKEVPARVFAGISADEAARLSLAGNNFRSENDITEFWAIKHLERSGVTRQRIATDAGLTIKSLDLRNRWSTLDRRIFVGYANGRISATVARKIWRLPREDQQALGDLFAMRGRLQADDVEALSKRNPDPPSSFPVYENDIPIMPRASQETRLPSPTKEPSSEALDMRDVGLPSPGSASSFDSSGHESVGAVNADTRSQMLPSQGGSSPQLEYRTPSNDVHRPPSTAGPAVVDPSHGVDRSDRDELSATIVTVPATSVGSQTVYQPVFERLEPDIQRAVDVLARQAYARGIALDDMVKALAIAYRQVEFATKVTREAARG